MGDAASAKPRVAILEDHEDTRELLRISLDSDFLCQDFADAAHLLAVLDREHFSAVIADIMLPGLDGYEFIRTVRSKPRFQKLCVIAVTALAFEADRRKAIEAGFNEYLVKPVSPLDIAGVVWRCLKPS
jgi:CheY-like chemotaxis protein